MLMKKGLGKDKIWILSGGKMKRSPLTKEEKEFIKEYKELCEKHKLQFYATCFETLEIDEYNNDSFQKNTSGLR